MRKTVFFLSLFLASALAASAQGEQPFHFQTPDFGGLQVYKDARIDQLVQKQIFVNTMALRNLPGFRVQVISTQDRNKAMAVKARLMQLFPDYSTYLSYLSPYFRVRIGDFRDRARALELQQELNSYFPDGVFTVRDVIHLTPEQLLQTSDDEDTDH